MPLYKGIYLCVPYIEDKQYSFVYETEKLVIETSIYYLFACPLYVNHYLWTSNFRNIWLCHIEAYTGLLLRKRHLSLIYSRAVCTKPKACAILYGRAICIRLTALLQMPLAFSYSSAIPQYKLLCSYIWCIHHILVWCIHQTTQQLSIYTKLRLTRCIPCYKPLYYV